MEKNKINNTKLVDTSNEMLNGIANPYNSKTSLSMTESNNRKVFTYVQKFLDSQKGTQSLVTSYKFFVRIINEKNGNDKGLNTEASSRYYFYDELRKYLLVNEEKLSGFVTNVSFSDFQFGREQIKTGFYTQNYLQSNHTGYDINITFDYKVKEDNFNLLEYFNKLRTTYVYNGMYLPSRFQYRPEILIYMFDQNDVLRATFIFEDCFMVNFNNISLDYSSNDMVKFDTVWASDRCTVQTTDFKFEDIFDEDK